MAETLNLIVIVAMTSICSHVGTSIPLTTFIILIEFFQGLDITQLVWTG